MYCPHCQDVELLSRERLDFVSRSCPRCGGVWLERRQLQELSARTGLFLKARGRAGLPATALPGLKKPLWQELFDVDPA